MNRIVFVLLLVVCCVNVNSQSIDTLPDYDVLKANLQKCIDVQKDTELEEYKEAHSFKWFYLTPSVGYNVMSRDINVSFSVLPIIYFFKSKEKAKYKEFQIEKRYNNTKHQQELVLLSKYNKLKTLFMQLSIVKEMFKNYNSFAEIKVKQYTNNEINTEEKLKQDISLSEKKKSFYSVVDEINNTIAEISILTDTEINILFEYSILD
jgi:uncharacterized membrane protein